MAEFGANQLSNASTGVYTSTSRQTMKAFDKLSERGRHAVRNSKFDWAVQPILDRQRGGMKPAGVVSLILRWDREKELRI